MTIIEQIKTEIERRIKILREDEIVRQNCSADFLEGKIYGYEEVLSFLDTLESEKQTNLEEQICSYDIVPYIDDKIAKLQDMWREEKVAFDWDDMHEMIEDVARHFAQWGAEHLADARKTSPEDLEEAAIKYFDDNCYLGEVGFECDAVEAFIAGAKWQAEQLKK